MHKTTEFWIELLEINGTLFDVKKVVLPFQTVLENFYRNYIFKFFDYSLLWLQLTFKSTAMKSLHTFFFKKLTTKTHWYRMLQFSKITTARWMWATPTLIKFPHTRKIAIVRIKKINNNNFFCLFFLCFCPGKKLVD